MLSFATTDEKAMAIQWGVVIGASLVAAAFDLRTRRIPNVLTGPLLVIGLINAALQAGVSGFFEALGACALLALPYVLVFLFANGGAGDAKFMAVIGAWLGLKQGLMALFCVAAAGIVLAIVKAIAQRRLLLVLGNVFISAYSFIFAGYVPKQYQDDRKDTDVCQSLTVPYGVAILAGVCAAGGMVILW